MNQDKKDAIKLVFVVIGVFGALGLLGYYQYINDLPVKVEGKVIGTYIEASGWSSRTICIIDIDGERYNTSQTCNLIVGDKVKVNKYKRSIIIIERIK